MKNLPWKKIGILCVAVIVAIAGTFFIISSKGTKATATFINPAFGQYISSYTSGVVSSATTLRIVLASSAIDSSLVGKESSVSLFDLKPGVEGATVWLDERTVEFRPKSKLKSGQIYEVEFALSKLLEGIPSELKYFQYTFQVVPQNYELSIDNLKPYVKTDLKRQRVEGAVFTADFANNTDVEKILSATQSGRTLTIAWTHHKDGKQHNFVVEEVLRKEDAGVVELSANGKQIGVEREEQKTIEVPALSDFKLMVAKVVHNPNQYVILQFSDPLKETQNLDGLISMTDVGNLDFDIRDNEVWVYPPVRQAGTKSLTIEPGIRNILDYKMKEGTSTEVTFEQMNPAVRFTGKGSILPMSDGLVLPFEAVSLKAVNVKIIQIYEDNVMQFLQVNNLDGQSELRRVGKPIINKRISLETSGVSDLGKWNRFSLDLSTLINTQPGAIYQVNISFKKSDISWSCNTESSDQSLQNIETDEWSESDDNEHSYWDSYQEYYYDSDYDWNERDNPCHSSYYTGDKNIHKNVLASDLGLIAKRGGDGNTVVFANDIKTTQPLTGVSLELYDFQQQLLATVTTDTEGKAVIPTKVKPFVLIAKHQSHRGYLKLHEGESLSLSNFDVGGETIAKGLKGFLYGDRGVWRPGDSLYMTFILEDKLKLLPENHPVVFELQNPQGQITNRLVRANGENGFYSFASATDADAPTGNWLARVKVGGTEFTQSLKIETVKPNRLKINLDFGKDKITSEDNNVSGKLNVKWLHGAPGRNLKSQFEVLLTKAETKFAKYPDYVFEDPSKSFYSESQNIFDGYTDEEGNAVVNATLDVSSDAPGMLNAVFRGKAFEESGNFSIDRFVLPFYPYRSFTGIRVPPGDKARGMLLTDTTHTVDVVTIDANGKSVDRDRVEMSLYKLEWRWWWDNSEEEPTYMSDSYSTLISEGVIRTSNGKGKWNFRVDYPEWGRYLVKAFDPVSGHSTAKVVYIDWPGWAGRSRGGNQGTTMLAFSSDKPTYSIGEKASITIPGSADGRALVSIENGSSVLQTYWVQTTKGDTPFTFDITRSMTPNVFVHVTLMQPHAQTVNDLPIRLYGVIPIQVEDPQTHLEPVITMPDELEPGKEVVIKVSEKTNRKMTFTLAMVDEGLLDLTRFKTPDPWKRFYAREALGIKTWDLYDHVMGAFGSQLDRLLAIGGDSETGREDDSKANRFKPVVKYFGPITLNGGEHEIRFTMPQYIGSVRTMVVAGFEGAYGSVEKATPVRKPLMVLATLPRVLGPEEKLKLPVTLFTMDKSIKNVKVDLKVSGPLQLTNASKNVTLGGSEMTVDFDLAVTNAIGVARVEVTATSGKHKATEVIDIEVRNANPIVSRADQIVLEGGKTWNTNVNAIGIQGTNNATLEVSSMPPINLGQRMKYLLQYPYGCVEQTTSAVFPQLFVGNVRQLSEGEVAKIQANVRAGINRLKSFQQRDGGFAYWPGAEDADSWSSSYAGHFLIEAEAKGYFIPNEMLKRWKKFQKNKAQQWRKNQEYASGELIQAYRLYTLALAGDPEMGAMNRLREQGNLPLTSKWMLAAAYAKAGQTEAAKQLITNVSITVKPYQEMSYSYGSELRDKAIILETLLLLGDKTKSFELLKDISKSLSDETYWMSTQTVAWCLKSAATFASSQESGPISFSYTYNGKTLEANTDLPVAQITLPVDAAKSAALKVLNNSKGTLFVRVITEGAPARGSETEESNNLAVEVAYTDLDGVPIDPSQLTQGREFIASVSVFNPGIRGEYKNLAINQIFPSGWEINNLRFEEAESRLKADKPTYQDIRDDRVYTYFDLKGSQRKTFKVLLTATYAGTYYLPSVSVEAMYDKSVYARKKGQPVEVLKPIVQ